MTKYLLLLVALLSLQSCKKDNPDEGNIVNPPSETLLRKFILLDPAQSAPNDTIRVSSFTYDSLNRCSFIQHRRTPRTWTQQIFYNGSDSLMYKRVSVFTGFSNGTETENFTYGSNAKISTHTLTSSPSSTHPGGTLIYTYNSQSTTNIELELRNASNPVLRANYELDFDSRNNLRNEVDSFYDYNVSTTTHDFRGVATITNEYDNKKNPFYKIVPRSLVMLEHENYMADDYYSYSIDQRNNFTEEQRTVSAPTGLLEYHHIFSYTYNADDYPLTVEITDQLTGEIKRGIFIY